MENELVNTVGLIAELNTLKDKIIENNDGLKYFNGLMAVTRAIGHLEAEKILILGGYEYAKPNSN